MSYLLLKTVSEKLNQPTGIAVIASVGIHVVLGLTLPSYIPVFSSEAPPTRRTVQLLELSEADLSRLPDLSVPSLPPSIYQQTPLTSPFPPLPPLSRQDALPLDGTISMTPPSQALKRPSSSPTRQPLKLKTTTPPLKSTPNFPPYRPKELSELLRGIQGIQPAPQRTLAQNNQNPPPSTTEPSSNTRLDALARQIRTEDNVSRFDNKLSPPPEAFQPKKETVALASPHPESTEGNTQPEGEREHSSTDTSEPEPTPKPENANTPPEQRASNPSAANNQAQTSPRQSRLLMANYPQAACPKPFNGSVVYRVVVGTNGQPTNLQLIQSAGDSVLDQTAHKRVNTQRFERTEQPQEYQVSVQFPDQDKVCPKPTPPEPSNQGNPERSNSSPTPQPETPEASEESKSNQAPAAEPETSEHEPTNSGQQSPSDTPSESEAKTAKPEESTHPQPSPEAAQS